MQKVIESKQEMLHRRLGGRADAEFALGLLTVGRRVDRAYNALLADFGLSGGRFAAMLAVSDEPGITPARLADRLEVRRATVTGLVDGLVGTGLVSREASETDRRTQALELTDEGEALLVKAIPAVHDELAGIAAGVGAGDRDASWRAFATVSDNINGDNTEEDAK